MSHVHAESKTLPAIVNECSKPSSSHKESQNISGGWVASPHCFGDLFRRLLQTRKLSEPWQFVYLGPGA